MKLIMNPIYGKTILRPTDTELRIAPNWKCSSFALRRHHFIEGVVKAGYEYYVELIKSIHDHSNLGHIGVEIRSTSKRKMNEVMCRVEDNNSNMLPRYRQYAYRL